MSQLIPFEFSDRQIRVVQIDGEPFFVGKDVCLALGYTDPTTAIRSHCKGVQKQHPLQTPGGIQEMRVLTEADVLRLIVSSTLPAAEAFERWVFEEVLPTIRKTGGYTTPTAPRQPTKIEVELAGAEAFVRMLKPAPSSQVSMLTHIIKANGGDPGFLPSYVIDAAPDSASGSSMETKPLTDLLKMHGINMRACAYNRLLEDAGFLSRNTRRSTSEAGGMKQYWTVTKAGLRYGKNVTNPGNPRETHPHWYVERFAELHQRVSGHSSHRQTMQLAA